MALLVMYVEVHGVEDSWDGPTAMEAALAIWDDVTAPARLMNAEWRS